MPLLRALPRESTWPKTALLGIAFSCNLGGMTTPIASPQNILLSALPAPATHSRAMSDGFRDLLLRWHFQSLFDVQIVSERCSRHTFAIASS